MYRFDVLDVETDVVTGNTLNELLVVHFDGLDFSGDVGGSEGDNHSSLDDTSLNTTDGHRANTTDLVDILERKTQGLVRGTDGGLDGIDGIEEGLSLDDTTLGLLGPALEPWHAINNNKITQTLLVQITYLVDSSNMLSPCHPEMGTKATALGL
jgi:hypothetical protein